MGLWVLAWKLSGSMQVFRHFSSATSILSVLQNSLVVMCTSAKGRFWYVLMKVGDDIVSDMKLQKMKLSATYGLVFNPLIISQQIHIEAEYWRKACSILQSRVLEKEISVGCDSSSLPL